MKRSLATAAFALASPLIFAGGASAYEQIIGEVRLFGFNFCPVDWSKADGKLLNIMQYQALFALYGDRYGGNGTSTFALPDLNGRAPVGSGPEKAAGTKYGDATVTLNVAQLPAHTHQSFASSKENTSGFPTGALLPPTVEPGGDLYAPAGSPADKPMNEAAIGKTGEGQPVPTQSPVLAMTWCVAIYGVWPSRD